jgi:preprotein translocase SecE subunit
VPEAHRAPRDPLVPWPTTPSTTCRRRRLRRGSRRCAPRRAARSKTSSTRSAPRGRPRRPDPLKHASAYVDEAKLAEAGAELPEDDAADLEPLDESEYPDVEGGVELDEDYSAAPDQLQAPEPTRRSQAAADAANAGQPRKQRGKVLTFLGHCVDELRRVQWPNRQQVGQGTAVTLGFVVIAGSYLGLMDAIWKPVVEAIL